jgi:hypothetical protein
MSRLRAKLTYANVISSICLFLLLGGGAAVAATQLPPNSVGPKQIKKNSIPGNRIKKGTLTGTQINPSTIGKVPSAAKADTAGSAETAKTATTATNSGHATTADNAGHATSSDNSTAVGGFKPNELTRTASATKETETVLTGTTATLVSAQITAPKAGFLIVTSSETFTQSGTGALIHTGVSLDGSSEWISSIPLAQLISMGSDVWASANPGARFEVAAGTHTVSLQAHDDGTAGLTFRGASLIVTYSPF